LLHLQCELPAALQPVLVQWWEDFHYAELLSLPGFLWARRGRLIAPDGASPIVTMYGLADAAAADQPRPPDFTLLPAELDGNVTFHRRILQRTSPHPSGAESVGPSFIQLMRHAADGDGREAVERIRRWSDVLTVSSWRTVANTPHTDRAEVVHLRDTELIHAEIDADDAGVQRLLAAVATELPGWDAGGYRQAFPAGAQPV
jgi:hypothetical protein